MADDQQQIPTGDETVGQEKTVKFDNPLWQAGFTTIPNSILIGSGLGPYARLAYAGLSFYAREKEECFPGQAKAAEALGMSERTFRDGIRELEKVGLVATKRRRGTSNMYRLLAPAGFADPNGGTPAGGAGTPAGDADVVRQEMPPKKKQKEVDTEKKKLEGEVEKVWAKYVEVFEPGPRMKLGPNRVQGIKRALAEVDFDTLCEAIVGLKVHRKKKPGDETIEAIWKTFKGTGSMVERINFFASKATGLGPGGNGFPSAQRAIVAQRQLDVQRGHGSTNEDIMERAKESEAWLLDHGIETVRREDGYPVFRPVGAAE